MFVLGGGFLLPSSRVPGVCREGMVLDEIDTCIILQNPTEKLIFLDGLDNQ